jgi:hypothetical protein
MAENVPNGEIPGLAAKINSPAMLRVLQYLQQAHFIQKGQSLDQETVDILQRLASLGLVDPGYAVPSDGSPFIWVRNHNGERVLNYIEASPTARAALESRLEIHPRARTVMASLPEGDQLAVLVAAEALQATAPASWSREKVAQLDNEPVYMLRVGPSLRALIRVLDSGGIELSDVVRKEALELFQQRQRTGGARE